VSDFDAFIRRHSEVPANDVSTTGEGVAPGRRASTNYLRPPAGHAHVTGDPSVDDGTLCDRVGGGDCFLDHEVRARLLRQYGDLVGQAKINYVSALKNIHAETLVEKDEDIPWWATLLLGVISSALASGIARAIGALKSGARQISLGAQMMEQRLRARVTGAVASIQEEVGETLGKMAGDGAKEGLKAKGKTVANADHTSEKSDVVSFISLLEDEATVRYQGLLQVPATANDAELLTLFESMDVKKYHRVQDYDTLIRSAVDRFRKSYARKIGVHETSRHDNIAGFPADVHTKVAWIKYGHSTRLAYMDQDFELGPPAVYRTDEDRHREDRGALDDAPRYIDLVEDEFIDAAIVRHEVAWGKPPKTYEWVLGVPPQLREVTAADATAVANAAKVARGTTK
jgi:hypothetical protein